MEKSDSSRREHLQILAQLVLKQTPVSAAEFNFETIPSSDFPRAYNAWVLIRKCPPRNPPTCTSSEAHISKTLKKEQLLLTYQIRKTAQEIFTLRASIVSGEAVSNRWLHKWFPFPVNEKITWPLTKCFMLSARGRGEVRRGQDQKILGTEGSNHNHNYFSNEENLFIDPEVFTIC